jgi:hypothetical protein
MKTELCIITCANVQFGVETQVVELESKHVQIPVNKYELELQ